MALAVIMLSALSALTALRLPAALRASLLFLGPFALRAGLPLVCPLAGSGSMVRCRSCALSGRAFVPCLLLSLLLRPARALAGGLTRSLAGRR
jgi:hypothetical protein